MILNKLFGHTDAGTQPARQKAHEFPGLSQIPYTKGDPVDMETYVGQERIKRLVLVKINAMKRGDSFKTLLSAPAGVGKTSCARVIARELAYRGIIDNYFETVAGRFETKRDFDSFILRIPDYSVILIDEIHGLPGSVRDALLPAIQDNVYAFDNAVSMVALSRGISWIGATTNLGKVHAALQRRLGVITLEPLSKEERIHLVTSLPFTVSMEAADEMAERCWTPWELKDELYAVSRDVAIGYGTKHIMMPHAIDAFQLLGIDEHGLRPRERAVLTSLYNGRKEVNGIIKFSMSARALLATCGLDNKTYYDYVEPKLIKLGYIRVSSGVGRELTENALVHYFGKGIIND